MFTQYYSIGSGSGRKGQRTSVCARLMTEPGSGCQQQQQKQQQQEQSSATLATIQSLAQLQMLQQRGVTVQQVSALAAQHKSLAGAISRPASADSLGYGHDSPSAALRAGLPTHVRHARSASTSSSIGGDSVDHDSVGHDSAGSNSGIAMPRPLRPRSRRNGSACFDSPCASGSARSIRSARRVSFADEADASACSPQHSNHSRSASELSFSEGADVAEEHSPHGGLSGAVDRAAGALPSHLIRTVSNASDASSSIVEHPSSRCSSAAHSRRASLAEEPESPFKLATTQHARHNSSGSVVQPSMLSRHTRSSSTVSVVEEPAGDSRPHTSGKPAAAASPLGAPRAARAALPSAATVAMGGPKCLSPKTPTRRRTLLLQQQAAAAAAAAEAAEAAEAAAAAAEEEEDKVEEGIDEDAVALQGCGLPDELQVRVLVLHKVFKDVQPRFKSAKDTGVWFGALQPDALARAMGVWEACAKEFVKQLCAKKEELGREVTQQEKVDLYETIVESQRAEHSRMEALHELQRARNSATAEAEQRSAAVRNTWAVVHAAQEQRGVVARTCMCCRTETVHGAVCCQGCGSAWYCGERCQRQGWASHAGVCKILQASMKGRKVHVPAAWN